MMLNTHAPKLSAHCQTFALLQIHGQTEWEQWIGKEYLDVGAWRERVLPGHLLAPSSHRGVGLDLSRVVRMWGRGGWFEKKNGRNDERTSGTKFGLLSHSREPAYYSANLHGPWRVKNGGTGHERAGGGPNPISRFRMTGTVEYVLYFWVWGPVGRCQVKCTYCTPSGISWSSFPFSKWMSS
jgi:hypothetical protein